MKYALALAALLACGIAAPAMADNGHVPATTLNRLGLIGLESMSDADGMQIRGMSGGSAQTMGLSVVSGVLIDPTAKNFVAGTNANLAMANGEFAGKHGKHDKHDKHGGHGGNGGNGGNGSPSGVKHIQFSTVGLNLTVATDTSLFAGVLIGAAGGSGAAGVK